MSDFLLVVPAGWIEIPNDDGWIGMNVPVETLASNIDQQAWSDIDNMLTGMVILPAGKTVIDARLIKAGANYRLWVMYSA